MTICSGTSYLVSCVIKKNLQIPKSKDSNEMWVLCLVWEAVLSLTLRIPVVVSIFILRIEGGKVCAELNHPVISVRLPAERRQINPNKQNRNTSETVRGVRLELRLRAEPWKVHERPACLKRSFVCARVCALFCLLWFWSVLPYLPHVWWLEMSAFLDWKRR